MSIDGERYFIDAASIAHHGLVAIPRSEYAQLFGIDAPYLAYFYSRQPTTGLLNVSEIGSQMTQFENTLPSDARNLFTGRLLP